MGTHPIFESDFDCLTAKLAPPVWVRYMSSDEKIEISGELDSTPLIPTEKSTKSSIMASWSNISMPGNVGTVLQQQREKIRPWSEFADQKSFAAPVSMQEWTKRILKNIEHYQANYIITFMLLMVYCILTSPLLLIALAVSATGSYVVSKHEGQNLVIGGKQIPPQFRYALVGMISFPLLFIAGVGAALFWTLGVTATLIGGHASFRLAPETPDPFAQEV